MKLNFSYEEVHNRAHHVSSFFERIKCSDARYEQYLGEFLCSDVSSESCATIIRAIDDIKAGRIEGWEWAGNAWIVTIGKGGAEIENQYLEEMSPEHFTLDEMSNAVRAHEKFLTMDRSEDSRLEVDI